jgi:DNA-binding GntR family transcriptional regulator
VASHTPAKRRLMQGSTEGEPRGLAGVYQRLRHAILFGDIPEGAVVNQVELAEQLGVSRTPLREAIRLLEHEGLIEAEQNKPARAARLSVEDLEEVYALRITVEALAAYISVPKLVSADLSLMRGQLEEMVRFARAEDYDHWHVPHEQFHACLVSHSADRMRKLIAQLSDHAERYRRAYTTEVPMAWAAGIRDHQGILEAAEAMNADLVTARLARHYARSALNAVTLVAPLHEPRMVRDALTLAFRQAGDPEQDLSQPTTTPQAGAADGESAAVT